MSAWTRLPRWIRIATTVAFGSLLAGVLFGYERTEMTHCAACGAFTRRSERGVALSLSLRLPLSVTDDVEPMPNTMRFMPVHHVHGRERSVGTRQGGPYLVGAIGCGKQFPGQFAMAIAGTPGFADFVTSRIDTGRVDLGTVRALIAQPPDPADDARSQELVRRGSELIAEFRRTGLGGEKR